MCLGTARRGAGPLSKPSQGGCRPRVPAALRRPVKYVRRRARECAQLRGPFAERPERARGSFPSPPSVSPSNRPCARTEALAATPVRATGTGDLGNGTDAFPHRRGAGGRLVHRGAAAGPPRGGLFLSSSLSPAPPGGAGALTAARAAAPEERRGRRRRTGRSAAGWERERKAGAIGSPPRRGTPALRSPRWTWTTTTLSAARAGFFYPRRAVHVLLYALC